MENNARFARYGKQVLESQPEPPAMSRAVVVRVYYVSQGGELLAMDSAPLTRPAGEKMASEVGQARSHGEEYPRGEVFRAVGEERRLRPGARLVANPALCAPTLVEAQDEEALADDDDEAPSAPASTALILYAPRALTTIAPKSTALVPYAPRALTKATKGAVEALAPVESPDDELSVRNTPAVPTAEQSSAYQGAFEYFNRALFGGMLPSVLLNFSRLARTYGFFAPERWTNGTDVAHEISLNPAHIGTRPARDVLGTLVHEMAHLWQQEFGSPSRRGYHNHEWADKMESIGLMPSDTARIGGKRVGQAVSHYIIAGGPYDRAFDAMPPALLLPWKCREVEIATGGRRGGAGVAGPTGKGATPTRTPSKVKFTCSDCGANAWGKPSLHLVCGDCGVKLTSELGDTDEQGAERAAA